MIVTYLVDLDLPKSPDESSLIDKILSKDTTTGVLFDEVCFTKVVFDEKFVVINVISLESSLSEMRTLFKNNLSDDEIIESLTTRNVLRFT